MEERVGAGIEIFEITREKDDSEGIAITPFNLDFFAVNEHGLAESTVDGLRLHGNLVLACGFTVD